MQIVLIFLYRLLCGQRLYSVLENLGRYLYCGFDSYLIRSTFLAIFIIEACTSLRLVLRRLVE